MNKIDPKRPGQIILGWWSRNIGDRESSHARALAARLRRAGLVEALGEAAVHELARSLGLRDADPLVRLVQVLAEVRDHTAQTLAQRLGGDPPALSTLRFQRLMRVEPEDLPTALNLSDAQAGALFPAHAGMNRPLRPDTLRRSTVPRPRGDEPLSYDVVAWCGSCSPPTRG